MEKTDNTDTEKSYVEWEDDQPARLEIASILRSKAKKTSNPKWKMELNLMASQIERCRFENPDTGFKESACKCLMCPAYMTLKYAIPSTRDISAHFQSVHPLSLYFVRLTASSTKVTSKELGTARKKLLYALVKLTQSRLWRRTFLSWGGSLDLKWTPASDKHGDAGLNIHIHLICEADDAPEIDAIQELWLRLIGSPQGSASDFFYLEHVKKFDGAMTYVPHLDGLLPGYEKDQRGERLLKRMPVAAIMAFLDATKGSHRLLRHQFNVIRVQAAELKAKEEKAKLKEDKAQDEAANETR
jgi:hypothetical protein